MRRDNERLQDILNAIAAIDRYIQQGKKAFDEQELIQVWVIHHLQLIGEAATALTSELKVQHPTIPWPQIIGLRNLLVHEYFRVDTQFIWDIANNDLEALKTNIQAILENELKT